MQNKKERKTKMSRMEYDLDSLKSIRFFYNGVKVNGEKELQKIDYSFKMDDNPKIYITKEGYNRTPADLLFGYKEASFALVTEENPLFLYFYNATLRANIHWFNTHMKWVERRLKKENKLLEIAKTEEERAKRLQTKVEYEKSIQNTKAKIKDLESKILQNIKDPDEKVIDLFKEFAKKENQKILDARKAAEEEKVRLAEEVYKLKASHKEYAKMLNKAYPIQENGYYVEFEWSESPAIEDGTKMSLKAADLYLGFLDKEQHINRKKGDDKEYTGWGWYDKVKFTIRNDAEKVNYQGRYDLGDGDVYNGKYGIISHIMCFAEGIKRYNQEHTDGIYSDTNPQDLLDFANNLYEICYGEKTKTDKDFKEKLNAS